MERTRPEVCAGRVETEDLNEAAAIMALTGILPELTSDPGRWVYFIFPDTEEVEHARRQYGRNGLGPLGTYGRTLKALRRRMTDVKRGFEDG